MDILLRKLKSSKIILIELNGDITLLMPVRLKIRVRTLNLILLKSMTVIMTK